MEDADPRQAVRQLIDSLHSPPLRGEKLTLYLDGELRRFLSTPIKPTQEGMKEACQRAERLIKDFARGYGNGPPAVKAIEQIWQKLAETPDSNPSDPISAKRRNLGGRPPKFEWDAFWRQVVKIANTPDGLPARTELQNIMMDWCAVQWGDTPADSMIRDKLGPLYR